MASKQVNHVFETEAVSKHDSLQASESAFVLQDRSLEDVVKAIIQNDQQYGPFFTFDMDVAYRCIQLFKEKLPRVKIYYAMKANDSPMLLKLAVATGLGFDCASPGEIYKIMQLNVPPTSIIFASPTKTPEQMKYARQSGVRHTTFDSSCELKKLKQYWPDSRLLIRIRIESDSVYKLGDKFGCDFETESYGLLDEAANLGLRVIGVAFHVGSACSSLESYITGLQQAKALFDYEAQAGRIMKILDIGGGFVDDHPDRFEKASRIINCTLEELFPDDCVQVIGEPGRFISETPFTFYSYINNVRKIVTKENVLYNTLNITNGYHGSFQYLEKWHSIEIYERSPVNGEELQDTVLYGPTPSYRDFITNIKLPKCSPGNWLVVKTIGSYSLSTMANFTSFEEVKGRTVISLELWKLLKSSLVFKTADFIHNPDISAPLLSSVPLVLENKDYHPTEVLNG